MYTIISKIRRQIDKIFKHKNQVLDNNMVNHDFETVIPFSVPDIFSFRIHASSITYRAYTARAL